LEEHIFRRDPTAPTLMRRRPYEHSIFLEPEFIKLADQGSVQRKAGNFNKEKKNR
jgi:hypothetical protein